MPCRWSYRSRCAAAGPDADKTISLPSPTSAPDIDSWRTVRFGYFRKLRKNTKSILLLMAMMEALKHGPCELVYAGRNGFAAPGADDYGLAYTVGYVLSYIYVCIFMIFFIPLVSWWIPKTTSDPEKPSFAERLATCLKKLNMILLPVSIAVCLVSYLVHFAQLLIYVDDRTTNSLRLPKNTRKNWAVRLMLITGIVAVLCFGKSALIILEMTELAKVKPLEYYIILVPIQMNLGLLLGTKMQMRHERRAAMAEAKLLNVDAKVVDEKAPLIEV